MLAMERSEILDVVKRAIREQRCAALRYGDGGARVVEPHAAYQDENGDTYVDCYQTGGFSASGRSPPFWKRLRLRKVVEASLLQDTFAPRLSEGFDPTKPRYARKGLIAIVGRGKPSFLYPMEVLQQMGPSLPAGMGRRHA